MSKTEKDPDVMLKDAYEALSDEERIIELAKDQTVEQVYRFIRDGNRIRVSKFVYNRFHRRYLTPFEKVNADFNSGFAQIAACCLMIEAMESFRHGWKSTHKLKDDDGKDIFGGKIFGDFFKHYDEFDDFKDLGNEFYDSIRCGILHQAETKNGWRIERDKKYPLLDDKKRIIHSTKFRYRMKTCLRIYCKELEENDSAWKFFKKKMAYVVENCHKEKMKS